jgi:tetratricopeptide (TPR) repeat protein
MPGPLTRTSLRGPASKVVGTGQEALSVLKNSEEPLTEVPTVRDAEQDTNRDVRHLLRSLTDATALRSNRLARALVLAGDDAEFVGAVQRFVRSALPERSRMARILELCEIEGLVHKVAAERIGISMRQFYRERAHAQRRIREAIEARLRASTCYEGADLLGDELEMLHESVQCGRVEPALRRAEELLRHGLPADTVRMLLALESCAFAVSGRAEQSAAHLETARGIGIVGDDDVAAELEYAHAYALAAHGDHAEAIPHAERAVALKESHADLPERLRRAHVRHLALLGNLHQEDHEPHKALAALEAAGRLLQTCRITPQTQQVRVSTDLAATCLAIADMVDNATARAIEAYRSATWHGLAAERVRAEIVLGFAALAVGATDSVLDGLPQSSYCTFAGAEGHWLARMHLLVSRLQTAHGKAAEALASVRAARATIPKDHCLRALADLRAAEALNVANAPNEALPLALDAIPRMSLGGSSHYAGAAHVAAANALQQLGDGPRARLHCEAGLERLRRGGMVMDLSRALRLAARLTGDARYVEEQRTLIAG